MNIIGYHACREMLLHRAHDVRLLLLDAERKDRRSRELEGLAHQAGITVKRTGHSSMKRQGGSGGFVVQMDELPLKREDDFIKSAAGKPILFIEEVSDPQNLGSILRVAECAGFSHVVLTLHRSAPINETVMSSSAGAAALLTLGRVKNVQIFLKQLKDAGYWIVGAAVGGATIYETELPYPYCIILGSEEKGLRRLTLKSCDELIALPLKGNIDSLNVSTAAAAILYELVRREL